MFFLRLSLKTDFKRRFRFKLDPLILKKTEYRISIVQDFKAHPK